MVFEIFNKNSGCILGFWRAENEQEAWRLMCLESMTWEEPSENIVIEHRPELDSLTEEDITELCCKVHNGLF